MLLAPILTLSLLCGGGGTSEHRSLSAPRGGDGTGPPVIVSTHVVGYLEDVAIEIDGGRGRIRLPDGVKPPLRGGGSNGWWPLKNLEVDAVEIRARVALNPINKPRVRIDRRTGMIRIDGRHGDYTGYCAAYDPETVRLRF